MSRFKAMSSGGVLILVAAVLWGTIGPAQSLGGDAFRPGAVAGWRHVLGGVVLGILALSNPAEFRRLRARRVWIPCVLAGIASAAYQVTFASSVAYTGATMGSVVSVATVPMFTGVAARFVNGRNPGTRWMVGSALAVIGSVLLLAPSNDRVDPVGVGCGIAASALFTLYTLAAKRLASTGIAAYTGTAVSMLVGALLLSPLIVTSAEGFTRPMPIGAFIRPEQVGRPHAHARARVRVPGNSLRRPEHLGHLPALIQARDKKRADAGGRFQEQTEVQFRGRWISMSNDDPGPGFCRHDRRADEFADVSGLTR
jgi:drug/metabolite transporter (DMT)-like permease